MKLIFVLLLGVLTFSCSSSKSSINSDNCTFEYYDLFNRDVYSIVTKDPEYNGGKSEMLLFLAKNYTHSVIDSIFQASFLIEFVVDDKGKVFVTSINRKGDNLTDSESRMEEIFNSMPAWTSGECNGEPVYVKMRKNIKL